MSDDILAAALGPDGLAGPTSTAPAGRCLVGRILDTVSAENRQRILHLLNTKSGDPEYVSQKLLAKRISAGGYRISQSALSNHHRRVCGCTENESENN